jgi:hypothetical protein
MGTGEHERNGDTERDRRIAELEQSDREMREKVALFARILDGITEMIVARGGTGASFTRTRHSWISTAWSSSFTP